MRRAVLVLWVLVVGGPAFGGAPSPKPDPELERKIHAEIANVSAEAAAAWDEANAARDAFKADDAIAGYRKVIALAPGLDHPHRRLCGVLAVSNVDDGIRECEAALALAPSSPYDKAGLAAVLLKRGKPADRPRATELARAAGVAAPQDVYVAEIDCMARSLANKVDDLTACVDHLLALAPDDLEGNYLAAALAALRGDNTWASIYLERAKDAGLAPNLYADLRGKLDGIQSRGQESFSISTDRALEIGVPIVGGWILLLILLLVIGDVLSNSTLRSAGHGTADAGAGSPRERRTRRIYRVVLWLVGFLFYTSLPLMIVVVLFAAFATLAIFDDMGGIPLFVLGLIILVVISTIVAVVSSVFVKRPVKIDGDPIEPASYPQLKAILDDAAAAIGTRPVDLVYLTPGTDLAVTELRGMWRSLRGGRSERVLILGVGLFDGMKQHELRAILAHEYGHFRNDDIGGSGVLSVRSSLSTLIAGMARSRVPNVLNPAWWFVRAFTHLYLVVSTGASRLQEILADRWAIRAYGSAAFVAGARHVVTREVEFAQDLAQTIKDVVDNKWSLPNLYAYDPEHKRSPAARAADVAKKLDREPGRFESHPSWRQRIQWAEQLALAGEAACPDGEAPVWSLFPDPERVERDMTAIIRTRMRTRLGVTVSDAEWEDDEPAAS